jgi:hypothetical protein
MTLVDGEVELAVLRDLHADCVTGQGSLAVISGAVATGKTALQHLTGVYRKLQMKSRADLAAEFQRRMPDSSVY